MTASTTRTLRAVRVAEAMTAPRPGLRASRLRIARAHGAFSDAAR